MFFYNTAPDGNRATNGSVNTDFDHLRFLTGSNRIARIQGINLTGKGSQLTSISGISIRVKRLATPSSAGSAQTPRPRHPAMPAADITAFLDPTIGATPTVQLAIGCGAAGGFEWKAREEGEKIGLQAGGGANGNADIISQSGTASLNFELGVVHQEL